MELKYNPTKYIITWLGLLFLLHSESILAGYPDQSGFSSKVIYCPQTKINIDTAVDCEYLPRGKIHFQQDFDLVKWSKLEIHSPKSSQIAIYISPHFLKQVDLYEKLNGVWVKQTAGSNLTPKDLHNLIGGYYFLSEESNNQDRTFYLRIEGSGLNNLDIKATPWPSINQIPNTWQISIGMQVAGLSLILLFAIFSYLATPTIMMARFSWLMVDLILCILSGSGILAKYLLVANSDLDGALFVIFLSLRVGLWTWVAQAFLLEYQTPRWYKLCCKVLYVFVGIVIISVALPIQPFFQPVLLTCFIAAPIIQLLGALNTKNIERPLKRVLIWGFLGASFLILAALITNIYPFSDKPLPTYISRITDFVNPIILLAIILFQYRRTRVDLIKTREQLFSSNLEKEFEKQLVSERRVLIDMLTHELKNPLASINMAVGTLKKSFKEHDAFAHRRIENISKSVKNMDLVIERVSFMNALDQKNIEPLKSSFLLSDLLYTIVDDFPSDSPLIIQITKPINIYTDPQFLKLVLFNLIDNALKYSPKRSEVMIKASENFYEDKKIVLISVTNFIEDHFRPNPKMLFTRYYRHEGANAISGSGLGLSLAKAIANILGAEIQYQDNRDSITFTIVLPNE